MTRTDLFQETLEHQPRPIQLRAIEDTRRLALQKVDSRWWKEPSRMLTLFRELQREHPEAFDYLLPPPNSPS